LGAGNEAILFNSLTFTTQSDNDQKNNSPFHLSNFPNSTPTIAPEISMVENEPVLTENKMSESFVNLGQ
jgi:hypothetical protein